MTDKLVSKLTIIVIIVAIIGVVIGYFVVSETKTTDTETVTEGQPVDFPPGVHDELQFTGGQKPGEPINEQTFQDMF